MVILTRFTVLLFQVSVRFRSGSVLLQYPIEKGELLQYVLFNLVSGPVKKPHGQSQRNVKKIITFYKGNTFQLYICMNVVIFTVLCTWLGKKNRIFNKFWQQTNWEGVEKLAKLRCAISRNENSGTRVVKFTL